MFTQDLSRDRLNEAFVDHASLVALYLPMHTATRLALPIIARVRQRNPAATLVAYGLYARLSEAVLREHGVQVVLGPEAEADLVALARHEAPRGMPGEIARLAFVVPDRHGLPAPERYATLRLPDGTHRIAGSTDASRGCKHRCRHCPIVPVYDGHFRVVPVDVVLADVDQQVQAGVQHVTFSDPDFFNGPTHARRIIEGLHARHPSLTYDVTIKVEHLLRHRDVLPFLARTGCLFVTSAVESFEDDVLSKLEKGHTYADFVEAVALCADAGLTLAPTFVAFTPWTTLESYRRLLTVVARLGLVEHVAPVQWGLRLLITQGSRLLELDEIRERAAPFDPGSLTYPWKHEDPEVDRLQTDVMHMVGVRLARPRGELYAMVCERAGVAASLGQAASDVADWNPDLIPRATIPYLDEPWYC